MRKRLVAGNWKLNGSYELNGTLIPGILDGLSEIAGADVLICPPYVYLSDAAQRVAGTALLLGAQDVASEPSGAFTGEISAAMLRDAGCTHTLVGHSERRTLFGDSDEIIAAKFRAAQAEGLIPVLCVGETQAEREAGATMAVVSRQLEAVTASGGVAVFGRAIVAYEPVWAIGTGLTASPAQAQEVHSHIRRILGAADAKIGAKIQILYGGSVKSANAAELFAQEDIDGGLIGGASLHADEFLQICAAAAQAN